VEQHLKIIVRSRRSRQEKTSDHGAYRRGKGRGEKEKTEEGEEQIDNGTQGRRRHLPIDRNLM